MIATGKKVLILGNFDGVHLGHRALIERCVEIAKENGLVASAFLLRDTPVPNGGFLTTDAEKDELLFSLGIEKIYDRRFSDVKTLSPEKFVCDILLPLDINGVIFGFNYRFGHMASGSGDTMRMLGEKYHFQAIELPPVRVGETLVSSTLIREKCLCGDVRGAAELLGEEFSLSGEVIHGDGRGKLLGFPTVNLRVDKNKLIPKNGVYKTVFSSGDKKSTALTNIGTRPTFYDNGKISIETTVFDDIGDVYCKTATLRFVDYLREEKKFDSESALIAQIEKDKAELFG